jgi:hypothetical protein
VGCRFRSEELAGASPSSGSITGSHPGVQLSEGE